MTKKIKIFGVIACIAILSMGFINPIHADEEEIYGDLEEQTKVKMVIITDGHVTISDDDLLEKIGGLEGEMVTLQKKANAAYDRSTMAYAQTLTNNNILRHHGDTLVFHYDKINDTINKLWILRDEVVAFEAHYFDYVNETDKTLDFYGENIEFNKENIDLHDDDIDRLYNKYTNLRSNFNNLILLIFLIGFGLFGIGLFVFLKRRASKKSSHKSINFNRKSKKQPTLTDYLPQTSKAKKSSLAYKFSHIRRKRKAKKVFIKNSKDQSTLNIRKSIRRNPDRSPMRFLFSFFQKL